MDTELREAVERLLYVIEIGGGPSKLSRGVDLGQISWFHKCSDAVAWVRLELDAPAQDCAPHPDHRTKFQSDDYLKSFAA